MVRKGGEKSGEEAEEDRATGRAGEGHHHPEYQHEMHHNSEVRGTLNAALTVSVNAASRLAEAAVVNYTFVTDHHHLSQPLP